MPRRSGRGAGGATGQGRKMLDTTVIHPTAAEQSSDDVETSV